MSLVYGGYNLTFAVQIRKIMLYEEWQGNEERRQSVWIPTQAFLQNFANAKPKQITCFLGMMVCFPQKPGTAFQNIFIINHCKEAAYLGTVFNDAAFFHYARDSCGNPFRKRAMKVVRDPVYYIIPSGTKILDKTAAANSIKRYLRAYRGTPISLLANATISFLAKKQGEEMDKFIRQEAKRLSTDE